ncbi:MAG: FHA domain-containing protein [Muribaculaceae bacterium]|nr:FHA domain-containing protein [Muribaculaceae bacterium]
MDRLKGKTILLGKEPGQGRLLLAIVGGKTAVIGSPNSVPNSVSRCRVAEGVAHAKINVDQNGNMILTNMKPQNVTYVNGSEIVSKRISQSNTVELGKDRFSVSVPMILETAKKMTVTPIPNTGPGPKPEQTKKKFNIKHLEAIYNDYHAKVIERQRKQKKLGILASCSMFFTIGGGAVAAVANKLGMGETAQDYLWIFPVVGFIVFFISMYMRIKDTSIEDADATNIEYTKRFVCPNPDCGKFLGNMPYELMKTQYSMQCPIAKVNS